MSILEVVRPFIKRARVTSARVTGLCPFHSDRNPSFSISLEPGREGLYYCFSCHAAGNLGKFLRKMQLPTTTIDRIVKSLPIAPFRKGYKRDTTGKESLLPESILGAFYECPVSLLDAGFSMNTLEDYDIGFDNTRQRITFPLRNVQGQLIGISGRAAQGGIEPKYLIYTEREFEYVEGYKRPKKDFLWNLDRVYAKYLHSESRDPLIIVEGFKVCLWLVQNGFKNTTALVGSTMTRGQRLLLEHLPGEFILALDNDDAGKGGAYQIGKMLHLIPHSRIRVVDPRLLDRLDVHQLDELEADGLQSVLKKAVPYLEYAQWHKRKEIVHEPSY